MSGHRGFPKSTVITGGENMPVTRQYLAAALPISSPQPTAGEASRKYKRLNRSRPQKRNRCPSYSTGGAFYVHRGCCLAPIFITESGCTEQFREASCGPPATVP